jgi:hypothetical protein
VISISTPASQFPKVAQVQQPLKTSIGGGDTSSSSRDTRSGGGDTSNDHHDDTSGGGGGGNDGGDEDDHISKMCGALQITHGKPCDSYCDSYYSGQSEVDGPRDMQVSM